MLTNVAGLRHWETARALALSLSAPLQLFTSSWLSGGTEPGRRGHTTLSGNHDGGVRNDRGSNFWGADPLPARRSHKKSFRLLLRALPLVGSLPHVRRGSCGTLWLAAHRDSESGQEGRKDAVYVSWESTRAEMRHLKAGVQVLQHPVTHSGAQPKLLQKPWPLRWKLCIADD